VVYQWSHLAFAIVHCGGDALHIGAACFLVIINVIVGRGCNPLRMLISPLLATLGIFDGGVGWHRFATVGDYFPTA
jgi:hypothetical protein